MEKKKTPRWVKWLYIFSGSLLAFAILVSALAPTIPPKEIKSWAEWKTQRDQLKLFSNGVMKYNSTALIYAKADEYLSLFSNCQTDGCSEYKAFMRSVRDATADGFATPQELQNIAELQVRLNGALTAADLKYKQKFR